MSNSNTDNREAPSRKGALIFLMALLVVFGAVLLCQVFSSDHGLFLELLFVFLVLCVDLIYVLYLFTRGLRRPLRIGITSLVMAIFFTPGIAVGHGVAIVPAWVFLLSTEDQQWFGSGVIPIGVVFILIFSIQFVFSTIFYNRFGEAQKQKANRVPGSD